MIKQTLLLLVMLLGASATAEAKDGVFGLVRKLGTFIDSMSVSGVDRRYIDAPKEPWQIILRGNVNQTDLKMKSMMDVTGILPGMSGNMNWEPHLTTEPSTYVGLWAGYRGYGLGYSVNVGGDKGSYLTFGAMGGSFGLNFRLHRFDIEDVTIRFSGDIDGYYFDATMPGKLDAPINVRALFIDGYYLFNGRRCSYAAAYDQSVVRNAPPDHVIAGAMYYYTHLDFSQAPQCRLHGGDERHRQHTPVAGRHRGRIRLQPRALPRPPRQCTADAHPRLLRPRQGYPLQEQQRRLRG